MSVISQTNKYLNYSKAEDNKTSVVSDSKGKVLKLRQKHKGKVEANPFVTKGNRGSFKNYDYVKNFEYDFAEIGRIIDTESFVARLFSKKKSQILKEEPVLKSTNSRNADYIQKRLTEMEYVSGITFIDLLSSATESLVNYHNTFFLINRNEYSSSGNSRGNLKPIASLHILSPTRLNPIVNQHQEVIGYLYKSKNGAETVRIPVENIYHLHKDKRIDITVGTPLLESVKDDILSLRQVEESIERMIYKNASPLMHIKVGTDQQPAGVLQDGTHEIDYYNMLAQTMDDEGGFTTSHRVEAKLLGAESLAIRSENYLKYWKQRVLSGLNASLLDVGEADSISTAGAQAVSQVFKDDVISLQRIIERFFTDKLFQDLLLESPWYLSKPRVPRDDIVKFSLVNPTLNEQIKLESHLANLVRFDLVSREEFSRETGRELPKITLSEEKTKTGAFSANSTPQNQNTANAEYTVLDELRHIVDNSSDSMLFSNLYFFLEDNFKEILEPETSVEKVTRNMVNIIKKYSDYGIDISIVYEILLTTLESIIVKNKED